MRSLPLLVLLLFTVVTGKPANAATPAPAAPKTTASPPVAAPTPGPAKATAAPPMARTRSPPPPPPQPITAAPTRSPPPPPPATTTLAPTTTKPFTVWEELFGPTGWKRRAILKAFTGRYLTTWKAGCQRDETRSYCAPDLVYVNIGPPGEKEHWIIERMNDKEVALQSSNGQYLRHWYRDRVNLADEADKWEFLKPVKNANGSWSFKSRTPYSGVRNQLGIKKFPQVGIKLDGNLWEVLDSNLWDRLKSARTTIRYGKWLSAVREYYVDFMPENTIAEQFFLYSCFEKKCVI